MAKKKKEEGAVESNRKHHAEQSNVSDLTGLVSLINEQFGVGTVSQGENGLPPVKFISTGIPSLDQALGGGVPRGRIVEIYGVESCGKTTTVLQMIAKCQATYFEELKRYGRAAIIDAEHALDREWSKSIGVNFDALLFNQPSSGSQVFDIIQTVAKSKLIDLLVVDSVSALVPDEELAGETSNNSPGAQARLISKGLRKIAADVSSSTMVLIFINQIRQKIGVMFGNPETTSGGLALKFFSSIRMELRKGDAIKNGEEQIAATTRVKVVKNKVAPPMRTCEYEIYFGTQPIGSPTKVWGVDAVGSLFNAARKIGLITTSGSFFSFDGVRLGNGKENAIKALHSSEGLRQALLDKFNSLVTIKAPDVSDLHEVSDEEFSQIIAQEEMPSKEEADAQLTENLS